MAEQSPEHKEMEMERLSSAAVSTVGEKKLSLLYLTLFFLLHLMTLPKEKLG